ncbi:hypothetical protein ACHAQJ_005320 [Trichoderma viride]
MGSVHVVARDPKTQTINPSLIGGSIEQSPIWLVNCDFQPIEDELSEGEIIISGDCVSRGYYQDDIKTGDSFIYWNSLRVYKTGDYGRWVRCPAGDRVVEFRGRKDRTVKNGGFLVNLDRDVEDALNHAGMSLGVTSVCAAVTEDGIVAAVTPENVDKIALLTKARQTMCSYCIPYRIEALQKFPTSSNGKVQHKRVLEIISAIDCGKDPDLYTTTPSPLAAQVSDIEATEEQEKEKLSKILSAVSSLFGYSGGKLRDIKGSDSFSALGGSSLLAFKLISILRLHNLRIIPRDLFSCHTFEEIAKEATTTSNSDYKVPRADGNLIITKKLAALRKQARDVLGLADESFDIGPLASLQLVLAVPTLSCKSKNVNQVKLTYSGAYASTMERAWRTVWQAEPVFRTEICLIIGCGVQIIHKQPFRKPKKELYSSQSDYDTAVRDADIDVGLGCSLEFVIYCPTTSPGITAATDAASIPKPVKEMTIVLTVHHSLMDGISLQILLAKVERVARGWPLPFSSGSIEANLGLISIQQNRDVAARKFFSVYLKEARVKNSLINDRNGIVKEDGNPARRDNTVLLRSPVKSEEVADFARQSCVSIACIYYTAWAMAMSAIERDCTVIIGSVFSNRGFQPEFENTIGLYISTLPLVVKLDDDESVASLLQKVMGDIITIGQYAWASSDQIGIGSRVRSLVSLQPPLPDQDSNPPPVRVESLENSDFPLSLLMESTGEFRIVYDSHAFNKTTIRRLAGHFKHALRGILHYALVGECRKINELLETVYEQSEMVTIKRNEQTVKQALEASIDRFRNLVAIEDCKGTSLTYGQLDEQTNIIASRINEHLADRKVTAVAVYGDGSVEWLLGLLAILKTSRAFVPIDPKWPMERKMMVLEASGAAAVLIPDLIHRNQVPETAEILVVKNMLSHKISEQEAERLPDFGSVDSVLVFIFTSGTTGVPKGIPTTNQSFLALQSNSEATMFAAPGRRIAQFMSPAFDVCNVEIFSALLHGATLVLRDSEDPYANLLKVNTAIMTPAVLSVLKPDEFPNIEIIYSTGESITSVIVQNFAMNKLLYNSYGPAECAVYGLFERMVPGDVITIGVPSDTVRIYILDEKQNHVPHGAQGEIYLAGVQVLQQYINSPEQTALRILPDPWCPEDRMYRTGDYGICGKDNRVTYTGRMDRQVKIRGFRVELDGVEQAILSEPVADNICQCSVIAIDGTLVAYIKFSSEELHSSIEDRISRLRDRLDKTLLPSWVPQLFISLHDFPTSTNGKVDNKVLEDMYRSRTPLREEAVQRLPMLPTDSGIEHKLAEAWREVLQLQPHVHLEYSDNFFGLGGHSVLTMLLATKLTSIFEVKVTARELLPAPAFQDQVNTIERLLSVKEINTHQKDSRSDAKFLKNGRNALPTEALTDLERQVWLQYQVAETVTAFNIANILTISGQVDYSKLLYSFNAALASDPVLSCNFVEGPDGPRRVIRDATPRVREVAQLDIAAEINLAFNLEHDELIRLHFIQQSEEKEHRLITQIVIVTSHSIADLATVQNLLRLVSAAYAGENTAVHKTPQHLYSSQWQYNPSLPEQNFWKTYLKGHDARRSQSSYFQLPLLPSTMATFHGSSRTRKFIGDTITTLNSLIKRLGITHHQMALTVASLLLQWLLDEDDIILGAPNANRSSSIERDALGQFLDRLPIRIRLDNSRSGNTGLNLTQVLVDVRDSALQALANAIPFSKILESLNVLSGDLKHPIFDSRDARKAILKMANEIKLPIWKIAAQEEEFIWYLGYGSNMKASSMRDRKVTPLATRIVNVPTHYVTFDIFGIPYSEPSYASIEEFPSGGSRNLQLIHADTARPVPSLCGIAHLLTTAEFHRLLVTEGSGVVYDVVKLQAYQLDGGRETYESFTVYALKSKWPRRPNGTPSARYMVNYKLQKSFTALY